MSGIEAKLRAAGIKYRKDSKQYNAARYIIRQNREITSEERKAMVQEIPIKYKTLQGVFTKLRKTGLYPPQKTSDTPNRLLTPEKPQEAPQPPEVPQQPLQEYATLEDLNDLKDSLSQDIHYLASVISGNPTSNPGNYEDEEKNEVIQPQELGLVQPGEILVRDGSSSRESLYLKPKTRMYYDMAKQGVFGNYAGTNEMGPFANFRGSMSDFFNIIVDDYFIRNYYAEIGLTMTRYPK